MFLPKGINIDNLRPTEQPAEPMKTISASKLDKVGGLYRIRDNYESVWSMQADDSGTKYIIRIDADGEQEKMRVAEDDSHKCKSAFRTLREGRVYVVWECHECDSPNLTKEGDKYQCDSCHEKYADVFGMDELEHGGVLSREAVRHTYGPEYEDRMRREGITKIAQNLLDLWLKEASDPSTPFGGGVTPMGGSNNGGYVSNTTPNNMGGPDMPIERMGKPTKCPQCNRLCPDGGVLEEHLRKQHGLTGSL